MKKSLAAALLGALIVLSSLTGAYAYSPDDPVTVKVGLTGAIYEDIWAPAAMELAAEGINLEYVQFSNFTLPNQSLANGEIDLNAFQHHAYLEDEIRNHGYAITGIGDTFIVAMNIYSNYISDVSQLKDGDRVALPNDATNEGRALRLLESAGILKIRENAGPSPEINDIESYKVKVKFVEIDANLVYSTLPDVKIAVINGNYALDSGLSAGDAIFAESEYPDNRYYCLIAARAQDANDPVYKRVAEAYQTQRTVDVFNTTFKGFFIPAWTLNGGDKVGSSL